jgi:hypothetical protein
MALAALECPSCPANYYEMTLVTGSWGHLRISATSHEEMQYEAIAAVFPVIDID